MKSCSLSNLQAAVLQPLTSANELKLTHSLATSANCQPHASYSNLHSRAQHTTKLPQHIPADMTQPSDAMKTASHATSILQHKLSRRFLLPSFSTPAHAPCSFAGGCMPQLVSPMSSYPCCPVLLLCWCCCSSVCGSPHLRCLVATSCIGDQHSSDDFLQETLQQGGAANVNVCWDGPAVTMLLACCSINACCGRGTQD